MCLRSTQHEGSQRGHTRSAATNLRWAVEGAAGAARSPAGSAPAGNVGADEEAAVGEDSCCSLQK